MWTWPRYIHSHCRLFVAQKKPGKLKDHGSCFLNERNQQFILLNMSASNSSNARSPGESSYQKRNISPEENPARSVKQKMEQSDETSKRMHLPVGSEQISKQPGIIVIETVEEYRLVKERTVKILRKLLPTRKDSNAATYGGVPSLTAEEKSLLDPIENAGSLDGTDLVGNMKEGCTSWTDRSENESSSDWADPFRSVEKSSSVWGDSCERTAAGNGDQDTLPRGASVPVTEGSSGWADSYEKEESSAWTDPFGADEGGSSAWTDPFGNEDDGAEWSEPFEPLDTANEIGSYMGGSDVESITDDLETENQDVTSEALSFIRVPKSTISHLQSNVNPFAARLTELGCTVELIDDQNRRLKVAGETPEAVQEACKLLKSADKHIHPPQANTVDRKESSVQAPRARRNNDKDTLPSAMSVPVAEESAWADKYEPLEECNDDASSYSVSSIEESDEGSTEDGKAKNNQKPLCLVHVSKAVFFKLKSKKNPFATRLSELGCTVKLPRKPKKPVEVYGETVEAVEQARDLLKSGVTVEKKGHCLTHFVSVRLTDPGVQRQFEAFRARVRELEEDEEKLPERLFQKPEKLHFSLVMLTLPEEVDQQRAREIIEDCCREVRFEAAPVFRLRGLGVFGSAAKTRVLYVKPEPAGPLQALADLLHARLCDAGLGQREKHGPTLHATLLNTTFLTRGSGRKKWKNFRSFQSNEITAQLGEFDFGEMRVDGVEISSLTEMNEDGYYGNIGVSRLCFTTGETGDAGGSEKTSPRRQDS